MAKDRRERLYEMIPGGLAWTTIIGAVLLSFVAPRLAIALIILFDLYWLLRVTYFVIFLTVSWLRYRRALRVDWLAKASALPRFGDIYHLIFLPTYKEDIEVIRATLRSLRATAYSAKEKFIIVLAGEERDRERFRAAASLLEREFAGAFFRFLVTEHPKDLPGDLPGKGSNINWAGHRAQELVDSLAIPYENVIVSSFDVDTIAHPQYFAALTHAYLTHPNPLRTSYQPIALYNNNIWETPALVRIAAFGTTFWLMTELARPERMFTFSSHSMPFRALVDVGFWEKDIVSEDSRIFLQCLLHYDGEYSVTPIPVPVSMDTVGGATSVRAFKNLYLQQRRWAWGVEHFPYLMRRFRGNRAFPLRKKAVVLWTLLEGMFTWATAPLLIFILGYLPLATAPEAVRAGVLFQNTPHTLEALMRFGMIGVFATGFMSFAMLPPRPESKSRRAWAVMAAQWMLVPFTFIIFGAIPALDAQTRMMFGRYLGFNVSEKRKTESVAELAPAFVAE